MSRGGQEHSDLAAFKLQAKTLKRKSEKGDFNGLHQWGISYLNARIFGSFNVVAIFIVIFAWMGSSDYYALMVTSAYLLFNFLFLIMKIRKHWDLQSIREKQLEEFRKSKGARNRVLRLPRTISVGIVIC